MRSGLAIFGLFLGLAFSLCGPSTLSADQPSWIFQPGNYSNDPLTGERITQYAPLPAVEALPDTRHITSGYHRSRVSQFGTGGTADTYYRVENWGNGRGGLDAEWERVNDVWQRSTTLGSFGAGGPTPGYGPYGNFRGPGFGGPGYGPGFGGPGYGPGFGGPGFGGPGFGYPGGYGPGGF